jgi:hypothetical protein
MSGGFGRTVRIWIRIGNASDLITVIFHKNYTVASTLNPFWKDILDNFSNLHNDKVIDGNDVLSQSIWLNSHQSQQK